jgi:SAM-dependent methyltransferase
MQPARVLTWPAKGVLIFLAPLVVYFALYFWYQRSERARERRHAQRPRDTAERLLELAKVRPDDVVYDLECGDGTLVLAAARKYGVQSVCVDTYSRRIAEVQSRAKGDGTERLITFKLQDWRTVDVSPATVVALFTPMQWDRSLRGQLTRQLRPGTRIVAWLRNFGAWEPKTVIMFQNRDERRPVPLMLWVADGTFRPQQVWEAPATSIPEFKWP